MNPFDKLVASRLARRQQEAGAHPDADVLAAFSERSLRNTERQEVLAHLERCEECREVVALTSTDRVEVRQKSGGFGWWDLRWAAAAAAACMVLLLVWRSDTLERSAPKKVERPEIAPALKQTPVEQRDLSEAKKSSASAPLRPKNPVKIESRKQPRLLGKPVPLSQLEAGRLVPPPPETPADVLVANSAALPFNAPELQLPMAQQTSKTGAKPSIVPLVGALRLTKAFGPTLRQQSVWSLGSNAGTLWRSDDGGRTRGGVVVDGRTNLLTLSAWGADVWVGGDGGALFHSTDNGSHWIRIEVHAGDERLTEPIIGLEVNPPQAVKLKTSMGAWSSADGGVSWRRE